jgi:xanthine dehydrogenase molybdenum-binding subunit
VRALVMDTDRTPDGGPTTASRQTYVSGNAARLAARAMRERMQTVLAEKFDVPPDVIAFHEGLAYVDEQRLAQVKAANGEANGSGHKRRKLDRFISSISFAEAVQAMLREGRSASLRYEYWAPKTQPLGTGGDMHYAFSYATQAALVEVDTETGAVACLKVVAGNDIGRAINPLALQGQIEGGIVMGMGNCLTEAYITEQGRPWTHLLARYKMPSIRHTPEIISHVIEAQTADGPYGAKGVGEIASINTTPAIANAIANAVGVRVYSLPVDQDALLRAMKAGQHEVRTAWQDVK